MTEPKSELHSEPVSEQHLLGYHRFTREKGVNFPMYLIARAILQPVFFIYLRLTRIGREHARVKGPLIVAPTTAASSTRS